MEVQLHGSTVTSFKTSKGTAVWYREDTTDFLFADVTVVLFFFRGKLLSVRKGRPKFTPIGNSLADIMSDTGREKLLAYLCVVKSTTCFCSWIFGRDTGGTFRPPVLKACLLSCLSCDSLFSHAIFER